MLEQSLGACFDFFMEIRGVFWGCYGGFLSSYWGVNPQGNQTLVFLGGPIAGNLYTFFGLFLDPVRNHRVRGSKNVEKFLQPFKLCLIGKKGNFPGFIGFQNLHKKVRLFTFVPEFVFCLFLGNLFRRFAPSGGLFGFFAESTQGTPVGGGYRGSCW